MHRTRIAPSILALAVNAALLGAAAGQQFSWKAATSGTWETAANWSPGGVPTNSLHSATLGLNSYYLVLLDSSPTLSSLNIQNPLAELYVASGRNLSIRAGGATVNGRVFINSDVNGVGSFSSTFLTLSEGATLGGTGRVTLVPLGSIDPRARISTASNNTATATIGPGITIDGVGYLEGKLNSQGIISGGPGNGPSITGTLTQTGAGKISVNSSGTAASIGDGGALIGGTIETSNGGVFAAVGNGTISGSTIAANSIARISSGARLNVSGSLSVNGQLRVNDGSFSATYLTLSEGATLGGNGRVTLVPLGATDARGRVGTAVNNTASANIGPGLTIDGVGYIEGKLNSQGIIGGGPGYGPSIVGTVTQTGAGKVSVNSGGTSASLGDGGALIGGTIQTSNGGVFATWGSSSISGTTITANSVAVISSGANLNVNDSLSVNGQLRVNDGSFSATYLTLSQGATLGGTGRVTLVPLGTSDLRARLRTASNNAATANIGSGLTIDGVGYIEGKLNNQGIISGGPGNGPTITGTVTQTGAGKVSVNSSGTVASIGSGGTLIGGTIETSNGGVFAVVGNGTISGTTITANSVASVASGANLNVSGSLSVNGQLRVNDGSFSTTYLTLSDGATLDGTGKVTLVPLGTSDLRARISTANSNSATANIGQGITIDGVGYIDGVLKHNGTLAPGIGFGNLQVTGNLLQSSTSRTEIQLGGSGSSQRDSITGSGTVTVGGRLVIQLIGGYSLPTNTSYKFIDVGQLKGTFDSIEAPTANGGVWRVRYDSKSATIVFVCKADFNADGFLSFEDFDDFVAAFNAGKPSADFDADGFLTFEDFDAFVSSFQFGCG